MKTDVMAWSILGLLILLVTRATATEYGFEVSIGGHSCFFWRGFRFSENALQVQPAATFSLEGFSAGIWAEYDSDADDWLEVDYTASYAGTIDCVNLEAGYIHYDILDGLDTDEVYISAEYASCLNPKITAYYDINEGQGAYLSAGISHPFSISKGISLTLSASSAMIVDNGYMATDMEGNEFTGLFDGQLTATGSVALGRHCLLEPMAGYSTALSNDAADAIKSIDPNGKSAFFYGGLTCIFSF